MEPVLEKFVAEPELETAAKDAIAAIEKVFLSGGTFNREASGLVVLGHDTRISSPSIHNLVR